MGVVSGGTTENSKLEILMTAEERLSVGKNPNTIINDSLTQGFLDTLPVRSLLAWGTRGTVGAESALTFVRDSMLEQDR